MSDREFGVWVADEFGLSRAEARRLIAQGQFRIERRSEDGDTYRLLSQMRGCYVTAFGRVKIVPEAAGDE